jgi:uncharacterized protein YuzE
VATVKKEDRKQVVAGALALARQIDHLPAPKLWLDYDEEADVLYITLKRPQKATQTVELDEEGTLLRYRGKEFVGITVPDASEQ